MQTLKVNTFERLKGFLSVAYRHLNDTGAILPSSLQASRHVASLIPTRSAVVVEYGAGEGVVTRAMLENLDSRSRLFALEKLEGFIPALRKIDDHRLHVEHGCIETLSAQLETLCGSKVDAVVSGIPFSFLTVAEKESVVFNTARALKPHGVFVVYQHTTAMLKHLRKHFSDVRVEVEPMNIPPYFIMVAKNKHGKTPNN